MVQAVHLFLSSVFLSPFFKQGFRAKGAKDAEGIFLSCLWLFSFKLRDPVFSAYVFSAVPAGVPGLWHGPQSLHKRAAREANKKRTHTFSDVRSLLLLFQCSAINDPRL